MRGRVTWFAAGLCCIALAAARGGGAVSSSDVTLAGGRTPPTSAGISRSCPPVHKAGLIAFATRGHLDLLTLGSCRVKMVAAVSATHVRFSFDGRWLAYSRLVDDGTRPGGLFVVPAHGGPTRSPLGAGVEAWAWAPKTDVLFGLNRNGQLVAGLPSGSQPKILAGALATRYQWSFAASPSPDGRLVAVNRSRCVPPVSELDTIQVPSGSLRLALMRSGGPATFAGWSPNGRWLLYWAAFMCSSSLAADGFALKAVAAPGTGAGKPVTAVSHMLLFPDFLSWCGRRLIAAASPSRETQLDSRLVATGPPTWRQRTLEPASKLSWVSPACAPSTTLLAAAAGPNTENAGFGVEHRSIWLLRPNGAVIRQLTTPPARDLSDEAPRFSRDGRWILFVRSRVVTVGIRAFSRDTLELVPVTSGAAAVVPLVSFTSGDFSYYDHFDWPDEIDWYQPH